MKTAGRPPCWIDANPFSRDAESSERSATGHSQPALRSEDFASRLNRSFHLILLCFDPTMHFSPCLVPTLGVTRR
jgi:hypothetical protein